MENWKCIINSKLDWSLIKLINNNKVFTFIWDSSENCYFIVGIKPFRMFEIYKWMKQRPDRHTGTRSQAGRRLILDATVRDFILRRPASVRCVLAWVLGTDQWMPSKESCHKEINDLSHWSRSRCIEKRKVFFTKL